MLSISNTPNHNSVPGQTRTVNTRFVAERFIQLAYGDQCRKEGPTKWDYSLRPTHAPSQSEL